MRIFLFAIIPISLAVACGTLGDEKPNTSLNPDTSTAPGPDPDPDPGTDPAPAPDPDCTSTHPMVGWVADLPSGAHATSGTATIIDDCTVSVTNFNFDGGGVVVQFYGGTGGDYGSGFAIGEDIFGTPFSDETVTLTLPEEKTFDDMDGISVWCVEFAVSFTDAIFKAP